MVRSRAQEEAASATYHRKSRLGEQLTRVEVDVDMLVVALDLLPRVLRVGRELDVRFAQRRNVGLHVHLELRFPVQHGEGDSAMSTRSRRTTDDGRPYLIET